MIAKRIDRAEAEIARMKTPLQGFLFILTHPRTWLIFIIILIIAIFLFAVNFSYHRNGVDFEKKAIGIPFLKK
jgi:uncharacterized membrane protein